LIPRKANTLYKEVAKKLDVSEELVEDMTSYYWKAIRKLLSEGETNRVFVVEFGTFTVAVLKAKNKLKYYNNLLFTLKPTTFNKCTMINNITKHRDRLIKIIDKSMKVIDNDIKSNIKRKKLRDEKRKS